MYFNYVLGYTQFRLKIIHVHRIDVAYAFPHIHRMPQALCLWHSIYKITKFEKDLLQSCLGTYEFKDVRLLTRMKEKPAKRELKLFSVEVTLTPDVEDNMQLETHIEGSRPEMVAFLETMDVNSKELGSILKHAAKAMMKDFVQQVVNLSESLEGAEMEETED